jgi:hypothetical protein
VSIIYLLMVTTTEGFTTTEFATTTDVSNATDARDLPWLASLTPVDRLARTGQSCHPLHKQAGPDNTEIWIVNRSCEQGLAHTRADNRIIIPENIHIGDRDQTIRHELIHIQQRRSPEEWETFYRRSWSFNLQKEPPIGLPKELIAARRSNPDTWIKPWVSWMGRWWVFAVYDTPQSPELRRAHTVWWDTWKGVARTEPPEEWVAFFGHPTQDEHPHEIAAVMAVSEDSSSEAGRRLLSWLNTRIFNTGSPGSLL